ncbi:MAG TPA: type II secretion system secretin GspD [Bryobacteraceae bacterium]|nr:type II secretion system secretin GspD [Bryobacteraceae bacterium]
MRHALSVALLVFAAPLFAQVGGPAPSVPAGQSQQQQQQQARPQAPAPAAPPGANAAQPAPAQPGAAPPPATAPRLTDNGGFLLNNVSLTETIDILAKQLKINYILDPRVKGSVTLFTYGEVRPVDLMPLLETLLRVNGATMVKVGDLYRIIPINTVSQLPVEPTVSPDPKSLPDDERIVLSLIFLKYATATELDKLIAPFLGEGATHTAYEPANLVIIQDNSRSMKRTLELISLFDSDTFAGQRVKLFSVENSRPSDLVKDLDNVFKAYALSEKSGAVKFIPVDRINTVIAVAPNPGIFTQVEDWIKKLDVPVKVTAGAVTNYVYRVRYGRAETLAVAINALYSGNTMALVGLANAARASMVSAGMGYSGAVGGTNYMGIGAYGGGYPGSYGANPYGGYNSYGGAYNAYGAGAYGATPYGQNPVATPQVAGAPGAPLANAPFAQNQTGSYLSPGSVGGPTPYPHIIPNPFDNTLLIQGTPQDYESITNLLRQLDIAPRQVLIEAKIYEVDLTHDVNGSVASCLANPATCGSRALNASVSGTTQTLALTAGALLSKNLALMGTLNLLEQSSKAKVISAPSVIATDSIPATINVGSQIPVATGTLATGVQTGGNTQFAQTISQQSTGISLSIEAHVNSSGIVTMIINQQVSAPEQNTFSSLNSPAFSNRSVSTQVTVQDGDTVAIGGAIQETWSISSNGIPFLSRIPVLGALFGSQGYSKERDELIVFLTPHVIYDTNQLIDATDELQNNLKNVTKMMRGENQ